MKNTLRSICVVTLLGAGSFAFATVPQVNITVADSGGKVAYKGVTDSKGSFATGKLQSGGYVVQFNSKNAPKGTRYALVLSAGTKKVTAAGIAGEKLATGGVAMKIEVGAGLNIAGQVAAEDNGSAPMGHNGKPMVWIPKKLGSNIAAHWAESDSAEAKEYMTQAGFSRKDIQDKQAKGITPTP